MNLVDLAYKPALEQARLIRTKEISPLELTQLYLERIQTLDPHLGSYFTVTQERALADAKAKTEQLSTTDPEKLPPFFGVPTSIKDLTAVTEMPCTYGIAAFREKMATFDRAVVARMKQAGFTILGKTATPQLGTVPYTEAPGFPPTRNPWNRDYTPGGSSGGAAAAVAAGLCAIAQGTDGGGSIRLPAACCGLVGIKPARGRVSSAPLGDCMNGLVTDGPLARTVADAAAMLDIMSGYVTGDPYWLPDPEPSFLERARTENPLEPLKIAFATRIEPMGDAEPICDRAVSETVNLLEGMGHTCDRITLDISELLESLTAFWYTGLVFANMPPDVLNPLNQELLKRGQGITGGQYLQAVTKLQIMARQIVAMFEKFDVLLLPVFMHSILRVGEWADLSPDEVLQKSLDWIAPCPLFNVTGQPAIAIPAGFANGLPIGVQMVGRPAAESTLIALAAQLEAAKPWDTYRPPLV